MQGVTVQVETDEENNKITYALQNHTTEEVDYDGIPALEYRDGPSWQEVLTRLGNRRFDGAERRSAILSRQWTRRAVKWIWKACRA